MGISYLQIQPEAAGELRNLEAELDTKARDELVGAVLYLRIGRR
jgi:hypothetical protein